MLIINITDPNITFIQSLFDYSTSNPSHHQPQQTRIRTHPLHKMLKYWDDHQLAQ